MSASLGFRRIASLKSLIALSYSSFPLQTMPLSFHAFASSGFKRIALSKSVSALSCSPFTLRALPRLFQARIKSDFKRIASLRSSMALVYPFFSTQARTRLFFVSGNVSRWHADCEFCCHYRLYRFAERRARMSCMAGCG